MDLLMIFHKKIRNGESKMKDINYIIADNMKIYRKSKNLTQADLAEKAELSLDSIKRLESGKRSMSLDNFLRVVDALQIPLSFLLYEDADTIPEAEQILNILDGRCANQKKYLLHMLRAMSEEMDNLL